MKTGPSRPAPLEMHPIHEVGVVAQEQRTIGSRRAQDMFHGRSIPQKVNLLAGRVSGVELAGDEYCLGASNGLRDRGTSAAADGPRPMVAEQRTAQIAA